MADALWTHLPTANDFAPPSYDRRDAEIRQRSVSPSRQHALDELEAVKAKEKEDAEEKAYMDAKKEEARKQKEARRREEADRALGAKNAALKQQRQEFVQGLGGAAGGAAKPAVPKLALQK